MPNISDAPADAFAIRDLAAASRHSMLAVSQAWNASLDAVFYDVGALGPDETSELSARTNPEGSILIVHPSASGQRIQALMPWEFVEQQRNDPGSSVDALAVAGVGSSALGTAALARNVADYLQRPVAGVVSGFGLSDVLSEALGGWFVLGARNAMRDALARLYDAYRLKDHVRDERSHIEMSRHFEAVGVDRDRFIFGAPDSAVVLYLLSTLGAGIRLVVGHSKGSLSVADALEGVLTSCRKIGAAVPSGLRVVTLGAVTHFPVEFRNVHQFIGTLDYFGLMNSRPLVPRCWMPDDWHSLNSAMPGHLPVHVALRKAGVQ